MHSVEVKRVLTPSAWSVARAVHGGLAKVTEDLMAEFPIHTHRIVLVVHRDEHRAASLARCVLGSHLDADTDEPDLFVHAYGIRVRLTVVVAPRSVFADLE